MFNLPGVPAEYYDYVISPEISSKESFKLEMMRLMKKSDLELNRLGSRSKRFIMERKSPTTQGAVMLSFIKRVVETDD